MNDWSVLLVNGLDCAFPRGHDDDVGDGIPILWKVNGAITEKGFSCIDRKTRQDPHNACLGRCRSAAIEREAGHHVCSAGGVVEDEAAHSPIRICELDSKLPTK